MARAGFTELSYGWNACFAACHERGQSSLSGSAWTCNTCYSFFCNTCIQRLHDKCSTCSPGRIKKNAPCHIKKDAPIGGTEATRAASSKPVLAGKRPAREEPAPGAAAPRKRASAPAAPAPASGGEMKLTLDQANADTLMDWVAHNAQLHTALRDEGSTGAASIAVKRKSAKDCATYLNEHWKNGECRIGSTVARGFSTWKLVRGVHDRKAQLKHTLLLTRPMLDHCRVGLPGFQDMEQTLCDFLKRLTKEEYVLDNAHGLRQGPGPEFESSTAFDVHRDDYEDPDIKYTVIIKLTADKKDEPCSSFRVIGARSDFFYKPKEGDGAAFRAGLYHQSLPVPEGGGIHLKLAFFFKKESKRRGMTRPEATTEVEEAEAAAALLSL